MNEAKLSVHGVRKVFDGRAGEVVALDGADFEIAEKEFVTVIGTSGCGKSTLLSIIAGLEEETEGEVLVDGEPVHGPGRDRGVVFQSYTLFPWMTAQRNVEFALQGSHAALALRAGAAAVAAGHAEAGGGDERIARFEGLRGDLHERSPARVQKHHGPGR